MYSYEVKSEVEERIKAGENLKQINEDTKISISTLRKWEKGIEIRKKAKRLIKEGKIEEARTEIGKLSPKSNKIIILSLEILIAKKEENRKEEKALLEKQLKLMPENTIIMSALIKIVREEKDIKREKELLEKILKIEPKNAKAMSSLIRIAMVEGNIKRQKELLEKILEIDPENVKAKRGLKRIMKKAKKTKIQKTIKTNKKEEDFREIFTEQKEELEKIVQARELIKKSDAKDMLNKIEEIKELIEGIDETLKVLVESEAAYKAKIYKQAEGYLKLHKKESKEDKIALKAINKALSIAQTKNKLYDPLKWKEIYDEYKKARDIQSKKNTTNEDNKKGIQLDEEER